MQFLIYYQDENDFLALDGIIQKLSLNIEYDKSNAYKNIIEYYNQNKKYDIVFLDFSSSYGELLVNHITQKNPTQRIVLLNNTHNCYSEKNCGNCTKNHNVTTVIKPLNIFQIAQLFNDEFACENYQKNKKEFQLLKMIKEITFKYPFVSFNEHEGNFDLSLILNPLKSTILIELIQMLEKNEIKHYLLNDTIHIEEGLERKKAL